MAKKYFPAVMTRFISSLIVSLILATAIRPLPVQAHAGISEELNEVTGQIQADPEAPELYLLRGELHRRNGHWAEAIADFNKVQQLDPGNVDADLGMGRTYRDQGLYDKSIKHLDRTLARQPDNVRGLITRAKVFGVLGEPLAAAADYSRAIQAFQEPNKPLPEYYLEQARALEAAGVGYIAAALQTLDAGISRLGNIRLLEDAAIGLERKRRNYAAALLRLDRIIDRSVRKEALLLKRGEILVEAGRPAEAKADFTAAREAIDMLPPQRRQTRAMNLLRADIASRIHSVEDLSGGKE